MATALGQVPTIDEVEEKSQVEATTGRTPVYSVFDETEQPVKIGSIIYRDYESRRDIRGAWFENNLGRLHPLGSATHQFKMVDHYSVVHPLLDLGFEAKSVQHHRGGASFLAFMTHPQVAYPDPLNWDSWAEKGTDRKLELSVRVRSDLRRGRGISLQVGYFRLVCTNGLVAQVLDLGGWSSNHRNFNPADLGSFAQEVLSSNLPGPEMSPAVPSSLLSGVVDILNIDDPEKIEALPRLIRRPAQTLHSLAASTTQNLAQELQRLKEGAGEFRKLDLINALTNTAHLARSRWGIYDDADPLTRSLVDLVELQGVKEGVRVFE